MCFRPANLTLTKTCPECGTKSDATIAKCPTCGFDILNVEPDMPDVNAPGMPGANVVDPSDVGKTIGAPIPPNTTVSPKAPGAPKVPAAPKAPRTPKTPGV